MASLASINIRFKAELTDFEKQMKQVQKSMKSMGDDLKRTGQSMTTYFTAPLAALGYGAIKASADLETLKTSLLTAFQGNQAAADAAYKTIEEFSSKTPFQLGEVLDAFIKLKNMGLNPSLSALEAYGNTASAMGKSLNQMIEAVADAATGEFERLKEFGIKAKSEGDNVSFTFRGVTTTIGKNAAEIEEYLQNIGRVEFAGGIEAQSKTLKGTFSTMVDNIKLAMAEFGDIMADAVKPMVAWITRLMQGFRNLSEPVKKVIVIVGGLAAAIGPVLMAMGFMSATAIPALIAGFTTLTGVMMANPFGVVAAAVGALVGGYLLLDSAQSDYVSGIAKEQSELNGLVRAIQGTNDDTKLRAKLMDELNTKYPGFLGNLDKDKVANEELETALKNSNKEYERKIILQGQADEMQKAATTSAEKFNKVAELRVQASKAVNAAEKELGVQIDKNKDVSEQLADALDVIYKKRQEANRGTDKQFAFDGLGDTVTELTDLKNSLADANDEYADASQAVQYLSKHQNKLLEEMGFADTQTQQNKETLDTYADSADKAAASVDGLNDALSEGLMPQEDSVNLPSKGSGVDQLKGPASQSLKTADGSDSLAATYDAISEAADKAAESARIFGTENDALIAKQRVLGNSLFELIPLYGVNSEEVQALAEEYQNLSQQITTVNMLQDAFDGLGNAIQNAFIDMAKGAEDPFKQVWEYIKNLIVQMLAAIATAAVLGAILEATGLSGYVSAGGSALSLINGTAGSSYTDVNTNDLPEFASGAYVTGPTLAWVGEGSENEFVAPESMLADLVRKNSGGGNVDIRGRMTLKGDDFMSSFNVNTMRSSRWREGENFG